MKANVMEVKKETKKTRRMGGKREVEEGETSLGIREVVSSGSEVGDDVLL